VTSTRAAPPIAPIAPSPVADLDWSPERAESLGHDAVALWRELLERLRDLPIGTARGVEEVRAAVAHEIPNEPLAHDALLAYLRTLVLENATYTGHPGFCAFISGAGTIPGAAADLLAAAINQNVGGWRLAPGATEIELQLVRWFAGRLGLPATAGGFVTSGGAMSAFAGLKMARDAMAGWNVRQTGLRGERPLTMYASAESHVVNTRAADMLGLGSDAMRSIAVDAELRMRVHRLREAIVRDLRAGCRPVAVVATAGTVGTGAIDALDEIADVCSEHGVWLHVDGAYGGVAALTDELAPRFAGIARADSVALDPHKWLYTPHSGGVVLVRDEHRLHESFGVHASYVAEDKALTHRGVDFYELTPNFSRGFHALKIWISLLAHGWSAYSRRIAHDVALARWLYQRMLLEDALEPVGPPPVLSITCFRYVPPALRGRADAEEYLNTLNERIVNALQMGGRVFPSNVVLDGRYGIRACIVNFRTEAADMDALVRETAAAGARLDAELRGAVLSS
jgi:glutamate/tyrosine decarboxylase-like PLP-dependent enzyme